MESTIGRRIFIAHLELSYRLGRRVTLAEVGCLSNEGEADMLSRPQYRQQIAQALFRGISDYAKKGT